MPDSQAEHEGSIPFTCSIRKSPESLDFKHFRGFFVIFEFPVLRHFETLKYNSLLGRLLGGIRPPEILSRLRL